MQNFHSELPPSTMIEKPGHSTSINKDYSDSTPLVQQYKTDDTYALSLLQPLLTNYAYLPFTGSSLRPFCMAHMVNDIVINNRKSIIEFGSGISTIMIGRLIKKNKLNATLLSIEDNQDWVKTLTAILKAEQIDDVINLQYVPLKACKLAHDNNKWYDVRTLKEHVKNKRFDMVIVDGPMAWEPGKGMARYPAVPFIANKLEKNFCIYLDDAIRPGEQKVIKTWEAEYGINFNIASKSLAFYYGGKAFHTEPFSYYLNT